MAEESTNNSVWDIEPELHRMGQGHYEQYRDTYRRVAVVANATAGITLKDLYGKPTLEILTIVFGNLARPAMVSEKLLSKREQQAGQLALDQVLRAMEALPQSPTLYELCTQPLGTFPTLDPLFKVLEQAYPLLCLPFLAPDFNPGLVKEALDSLLALPCAAFTYADLYTRAPDPALRSAFNRAMVRAKRFGLLVELMGIRKPAAPGYVSDPADDRWDVRSCVPPENAVLFKNVHLKINTMAYLMGDLTYGDFFDLPVINNKVLPRFRARVLADPDYWFTPLERQRIAAALDEIIAYLQGTPEHAELTFREIYSDPGVPESVLIPFQRILDVKPEICLPFMFHDFDHAAAADAIDVFLEHFGHISLKTLYTAPPKDADGESLANALRRRGAMQVLLKKNNNLMCYAPGDCQPQMGSWCSTVIGGNCLPY
jgi:hypothetical protein